MRLALDHILKQFLNKPLEELMPELKIILRLSLYQLHYLQVEPYAAVNEGVSMTKKYASPRLAGLANAVLRNYLRSDRGKLLPTKDDDLRQYLHLALSFPEWLVRLSFSSFFSTRGRGFLSACQSAPWHSHPYQHAKSAA